MKCVYCGSEESKVIDSRASEELNAIKRRRECLGCGRRFNTYETIELTPIMVVKSNGNRERFSKEKIRTGILKACEKRPVSVADIDTLVANIEKEIYSSLEEEVSSKVIGEYVMEGLKKLDEVSYIRFASIYKKFKDISTFFDFVNEFESMLKDGDAVENIKKKQAQKNNKKED
ncbi:MAG: transcriptional repressor NrdR [Clostridia bacterium]|nr:transcriptional repressor NrdR [Clostridia bacterium]